MNARKLDQLLLLEQSGELSPKRRRQLEAELAASAEARRRREQLRTLAAAVAPERTQPAPDAAARIAARLRQAPKPSFALRPSWKPALAAAAALALLFGVRTFHASRPAVVATAAVSATGEEEEWTDPLDADFTELESLIATISSCDSLEITEL